MTEVIFYRDHPQDPEHFMQIGKLYRYDGKTKRQIIGEYPKQWTWQKYDRSKFWGWHRKCKGTVTFICVGDKEIVLRDAVEQYMQFNELCDRTNGLFQIGDGSINQIILGALERSLPTGVCLEERTAEEQRVIHEATRGGIMFAKKGYSGMGYKYDVTSCYPATAASDALFPIGRSEFVYTEEIDADSDVPALYHVEIKGSHPFFRGPGSGETAWITHIDIQIALDLGLEVQLIGSPNCLRFEGAIPGSQLFGGFVGPLFKLKREGVQGAKLVLNKCIGLLAKQRYRSYGKGCDRPVESMPTDNQHELIEIVPDDCGGHCAKVVQQAKLFSYPKYCIFNCFVTAYARQRLVNLFLDHNCIDDIVHIHTDGWITTEPLDLPLSNDLGGIKLEYDGQLTVYHVNKVRDNNNQKI